MARFLGLAPLVCLAVVLAAGPARAIFNFDFLRWETDSGFGGGSMARHDMWRRAAAESNARHTKNSIRLLRAVGKSTPDIATADVALSPYANQGHWVTVGVGTPPQPSKLILDMGSDLLWTQCAAMSPTEKQEEPVYDPAKSSSFAALPCGSEPCQTGAFTSKNCTAADRCAYENYYGVLTATGELATETFTFGAKRRVSANLTFGCGKLTNGSIAGASGIIGLSPGPLSMLKQLKITRFSYCLTPFADRKAGRVLFGAMADLGKHKKADGPAQTIPILKNPVEDIFYYVPLVGLSLGSKRLDVPAKFLELNPDGTGGTVIDSATTLAYLVPPAFEVLKEAVTDVLKLPAAKKSVDDYPVCFDLPRGTSMDKVEAPQLVLHFDGGADMVLCRDNYFQEPSPGVMCLAVAPSPFKGAPSVIGNVQQQNLHVVYDLADRKLSYAPTKCDKL